MGVCGIKNYGANCYLNSGLQIISRCEIFIKWLKSKNYNNADFPFVNLIKNTINELLKKNATFDPLEFIKYFSSKNPEFQISSQNCSQLFIRTLFLNINEEIVKNYLYKNRKEYKNDIINQIKGYSPNGDEEKSYNNFLNSNKIFPQSIPYSYFSGIIKTESTGTCNKCGIVKKYSFMDFFDQHIYLDTITEQSTDFESVLRENLGYPINVRSLCPYCKNKIRFEDISKIIKLPEILVFTIERYIGETNRIPIKPNERIDVKDYVEKSMNIKNTLYELFAINIRFGQSANFGHQICQIKKENNWYTLNDMSYPSISHVNEYNSNSYGLFYKKLNTFKL